MADEFALFVPVLDFVPGRDGLVPLSEVTALQQWVKVTEEFQELADAVWHEVAGEPPHDGTPDTELELADVVMALCTLAAVLGIDLQRAMAECVVRQDGRGRYAPGRVR